MKILKKLHNRFVFQRRVNVLSQAIADRLPSNASVLDVGCGSGDIDLMVMKLRDDVSISGIEAFEREHCAVPCELYDGKHIPRDDASVDVCLFVDVLHHTPDISGLLMEARRASRRYVLIKDHFSENAIQSGILKFMDWVGNRPYGVRLLYNYKSKAQWNAIFSEVGLKPLQWEEHISLYPGIFQLLFGRKLHFIVLLEKV